MTEPKEPVETSGCLITVIGFLSFLAVILLVCAFQPVETRRILGGLSSRLIGLAYWSSLILFSILHLVAAAIGTRVSREYFFGSRRKLYSIALAPAIALNVLWLCWILPYSTAQDFFRSYVVDPVPRSVANLQIEGGFCFGAVLECRFQVSSNDFAVLLASRPFQRADPENGAWCGISDPESYEWTDGHQDVMLFTDKRHEQVVWTYGALR